MLGILRSTKVYAVFNKNRELYGTFLLTNYANGASKTLQYPVGLIK